TLSMGHARALAGVKEDAKKRELAKLAIANEWSVRELEETIQKLERGGDRPEQQQTKSKKRDPFIEQLEESLRERFKTTVKIKQQKDKGRIELLYYNKQDLERLLELLDQLA